MQTLDFNNYALTNHLGNVLSVVTDNINISPDSAFAKIVAATDYYAFGSEMPGRTYSSPVGGGQGGYRYGFNGKEKDTENTWGDTNYDYGFRIYNPRYGRFLSVDPLTQSYPMLTPYQFASNTPIEAVDLDGLEALKTTVTHFDNKLKIDFYATTDNITIVRYVPIPIRNETTNQQLNLKGYQDVLKIGSGFASSGTLIASEMDKRFWIDNKGTIRSRFPLEGNTRAFYGNTHVGFAKNSVQLNDLAKHGFGNISKRLDFASTAIDGSLAIKQFVEIEGSFSKKINTQETGNFIVSGSLTVAGRYYPIVGALDALYSLTTTNSEYSLMVRRNAFNEYKKYASGDNPDSEKAQKFLDIYLEHGGSLPNEPLQIKPAKNK